MVEFSNGERLQTVADRRRCCDDQPAFTKSKIGCPPQIPLQLCKTQTYAKWSFSSSLKSSVKAAQLYQGVAWLLLEGQTTKSGTTQVFCASEDNMLASI